MKKEYSFKDRSELADALLACPTVSDLATRKAMVDELPEDIRSSLRQIGENRPDVMAIIRRCLDFDGGLAEFIEIVRYYERNSRHIQAVDRVARRFADSEPAAQADMISASRAANERPRPPRPETPLAEPKPVQELVFISHDPADSAIAKRLYADLRSAGVNPWMASVDLLSGANVQIGFASALNASRFFIALLSRQALTAHGEAQREMRRALTYLEMMPPDEIFLIPVRLDDCRPLEPALAAIKPADLFPDYGAGLAQILKVVAPGVQAPPVKSPTEFRLSVVAPDWGGVAYRVLLRDRVMLGHLRDAEADIILPGPGIKRRHGVIERRGTGYYLTPQNGSCQILGAPDNSAALRPGQELRLGDSLTLKVAAASTRALVLDMTESYTIDPSLRGVILMQDELQLGPSMEADIRIAIMGANIRLLRQGPGWVAETAAGRRELAWGETLAAENARILIVPVSGG